MFCTECGKQLPNGAKFCMYCGNKVEAAPAAAPNPVARPAPAPVAAKPAPATTANPAAMRNVTSAVRTVDAGLSQEQRERKEGKQQWSMFETNYQRNKGITTQQSLDEIDDFCNEYNGKEVSYVADKHYMDTTGAQAPSQGLNPNRFRPSQPAQPKPVARPAAAAPAAAPAQSRASDPANFQRNTGAGENFFAQMRAKEAEKYKPGYKGN